MKEYDKIFNSEKTNSTEAFDLATGYISTTAIFFEREKILVKIEKSGNVEFFDCDDKLLATVSIPAQTGGREDYDQVKCSAENGKLTLSFPVVKWIDNYPHCDGEHDRWDREVIGYHTLVYCVASNEYTID